MSENGLVQVRHLSPHTDKRGGLLKILMRQHLPERAREFGEIYISWAAPGAIKANHYHEHTTEWFCLLRGQALLVVRDPKTGKEERIRLEEHQPVVVTVPAGIAHALVNDGDEPAHLLAYADHPYNPANPDTIPYEVVSEQGFPTSERQTKF